MSKKFRSLVGAMLSASICSSCVSSGLSKGVKWGAVGVPVAGAFVYLGGRKLGLWGANRRGIVRIARYYNDNDNAQLSNKDGDGNLLGGNNDNDDTQSYNEEKVAKRAKDIKELVKEENYNTLKALYGQLRDNWGNVEKFLRFDEYSAETAVPYLKRMFELIFVSGECGISELVWKDYEVGFCVNIPQCTFTIKFPEQGKVSIKVCDREGIDLVLNISSI